MSNSHDDGLGVKAAGYYGGYKLAQQRQEHSDVHAIDGGAGSLGLAISIIGWVCWLACKYPRTAAVVLLCWFGFWQVDHMLYDYSPARFAKYISFVTATPGGELQGESLVLTVRSTDPTYSVYNLDAVCHVQSFYDKHQRYLMEDGWQTFVAARDNTTVKVAPHSISTVTVVPPSAGLQGSPFDIGRSTYGHFSSVEWKGRENTRILTCMLAPPSDDARLAWQAAGRTPDPAGCNIDKFSNPPDVPCHNLQVYDYTGPNGPNVTLDD